MIKPILMQNTCLNVPVIFMSLTGIIIDLLAERILIDSKYKVLLGDLKKCK